MTNTEAATGGRVLSCLNDLLFTSKIREAAVAAGVAYRNARSIDALRDEWQAGEPKVVVVDLNATAFDPFDVLRFLKTEHPNTPVVCFMAHVDTELEARALEVGFADIMPRSRFVQVLPEIVGS